MGHAVGGRKEIERRELVVEGEGRVDTILAAAYPDLSRARLQRLVAAGSVLVNGEAVRKSCRVFDGDRLCVEIPEVSHASAATGIELTIIFEDEVLVAVNKPAGLAVHGAPGDMGPSVAAWFLERFAAEARAFDAERPGIVHRLDKDTSGVLLLAKTPAAQAALSRAFEERTTKKTYLALCDGVPAREHAVIDAAIGRHPGDRTRMAIATRGREARTGYELLATNGEQSLLLVHPESGRTHQIRVHLAAVGVPVANDRVYGKGDGHGRQLLHAWQIVVPHPAGGTLTATAELPSDFVEAVRSIGAESTASPYTRPTPPVRAEDAP